MQRRHQLAGILGADGDSGGFGGDVRLPPPEAHPHIGEGQGRGVVDAVPHHHDTASFLELSDVVRLVLGQHLGVVGVDVHFPGHFRRYLLGVPGEHDDLVDAVAAHLVEGLFHAGTNGVIDGDEPQELFVPSHVNAAGGQSRSGERVKAGDGGFLHKFPAAHQDAAALIGAEVGHPRFHPPGHHGLGRFMLGHFPASGLHVLLNGHGQGMDGVHFRRSGQKDRLFLRHPFRRFHGGDLRNPHGNGAGFVQDNRVRLGEGLDVVAALH